MVKTKSSERKLLNFQNAVIRQDNMKKRKNMKFKLKYFEK